MKAILSILMAVLVGCGSTRIYPGTPTTAPWVQKTETTIDTNLENTPVIFKGRLLYVSCNRDGAGINVFDQNAVLIAHQPASMYLCSAIVTDDGMLHVFGSYGDAVMMASTTDLIAWKNRTGLQANQTLYNTSVAKDATGYVMAYETCKGFCTFSFAHSSDLFTWTKAGKWLDSHYTACPTIRFVNGYYYVMFLGSFENEIYATMIARSNDLSIWQTSSQAVVSPLDGLDAQIGSKNTSDLDLVEVAGMVLIEYQNFVQSGPTIPGTGTRLAFFQGKLTQFFEKFFE